MECAFGEIDRRWGIFWKPLAGTLEEHRFTIDSCFRLHNLIVNFREKMRSEGRELNEELDMAELNNASENFNLRNPLEDLGVIGDNVSAQGRPTDDEIFERQRGIELRDEYTDAIKRAGLARPPKDTNTRDRYNRMV